jgi:hypothetical protein
VWGANIVVKITPPTAAEAKLLEDRTILSFIQVIEGGEESMERRVEGGIGIGGREWWRERVGEREREREEE